MIEKWRNTTRHNSSNQVYVCRRLCRPVLFSLWAIIASMEGEGKIATISKKPGIVKLTVCLEFTPDSRGLSLEDEL
eukprot:m.140169 g.140169  ORF g.140169 m.140169 type:complete len:76 (+) comp22783_c0_seq1:2903-3130(+)